MDDTNSDPTTPLDSATYRPRVRTQAELERLWRTLMCPLGFTDHSLWVMVVDRDDHPVPRLIEITELARDPDPEGARGLAAFLRDLLADEAPGGRVALLRTRPGRSRPDASDLDWAAAIYTACGEAGVATSVLHLAADDDVLPLPLDALPRAARSA